MKKNENSAKFLNVKNMVAIAMLAGVATILYYVLEIPVSPTSPHLKINLSDIPAIVGGLVISPAAAVLVLFIRCVLHLFRTTTGGIGEMVDFFVGISMMLPFLYSYRFFTKKFEKYSKSVGYIISLVIGIISTVIGGAIANMIFYPIFMYVVLGGSIESGTVFFLYLLNTVPTNLLRSVSNLGFTAIFIPTIGLLKRTLYQVK